MLEPELAEIFFVHEDDIAASGDAAIPVAERIDGGVVLVVAANGRECERAGPLCRTGGMRPGNELGLAGGRVPASLRRPQGQAKAAAMTDTLVEVLDTRKHRLDGVANAIVVAHQLPPRHLGMRQRSHG